MITAIVCLSLLTIILTYVTINLLRKCESQEDYIELLQSSYNDLKAKARKVNDIITKADVRGSFEADDEVGFMFEQMKDIQTLLNDLMTLEQNEEVNDGDSNG